MVHGLTERNGGRTPDVPGRTTAHTPGLAGLHTLQEVVVLLLLAGLLRPVDEVVLGDSDVEICEEPRLMFASLVNLPNPGEGEAVGQDMIELGIMEDNCVGYIGVQKERVRQIIGVEALRALVGVAHPVVGGGQVAAPVGDVHLILFDTGAQGKGLLLHTAENI